MGGACEEVAVHPEGPVAVVVVVGRLVLLVGLDPGGLGWVQLEVEGVLPYPGAHAVEQLQTVVARVAADLAAEAALASCQGGNEKDDPVLQVVVPVVVGPHAHGEEGLPGVLGYGLGEGLYGADGGPAHLRCRLGVEVVHDVLLQQVEDRSGLDNRSAVGQGDVEGALQGRIEVLGVEDVPHVVPGERLGPAGSGIPHDEVTPLLALLLPHVLDALVRQGWCGFARAEDLDIVGQRWRRIAREDVRRPQQLSRVHADQQRQVGEPLHVGLVVEVVPQEDVCHS